MKKSEKILIIVLIVLVLLFLAFRIFQVYGKNFIAKIDAVVMQVRENGLLVMNIEDKSLASVGFTDKGNIGFKEGQEIAIYFDGMVALTYPAQLGEAGKIKITKEKSEVEIPEDVLRYLNSSINKVEATVNKLTKTGISFTLKDPNEYSYEYQNTYTISKKVIKENKVEDVNQEQANKDATNYVSPSYTPKYITVQEDLPKKTEINSETTGKFEKIDEYTTQKTYDWSELYGELGERRI